MVLDLKMPGIDGIEVLRRVKRDHPGVEVIILTGHGSQKEEEIANQLGAFAYLRKPVDIELLTNTMKQAYRKIGKPPRLGRSPGGVRFGRAARREGSDAAHHVAAPAGPRLPLPAAHAAAPTLDPGDGRRAGLPALSPDLALRRRADPAGLAGAAGGHD